MSVLSVNLSVLSIHLLRILYELWDKKYNFNTQTTKFYSTSFVNDNISRGGKQVVFIRFYPMFARVLHLLRRNAVFDDEE